MLLPQPLPPAPGSPFSQSISVSVSSHQCLLCVILTCSYLWGWECVCVCVCVCVSVCVSLCVYVCVSESLPESLSQYPCYRRRSGISDWFWDRWGSLQSCGTTGTLAWESPPPRSIGILLVLRRRAQPEP